MPKVTCAGHFEEKVLSGWSRGVAGHRGALSAPSIHRLS
jgi:hypothetical protein